MGYEPGDAVDVKVGGSLGRWISGGVVVSSRREGCVVDIDGKRHDLLLRLVRRARSSDETAIKYGRGVRPEGVKSYPPKPKPKNRTRVEIGRGPLRLPAYRAWVKTKPCCFCFANVVDPHHYGPKGMGQQTDDTRLTPVCRQAHDALHAKRADQLCKPAAYMRPSEQFPDPEWSWAIVESHVYRVQGDVLAEFIRTHGGQLS